MVFPVVMYGCESWTVKKAEGQKIDASELWCWRRLLRVPWTARRSALDSFGRNDAEAETPVLWPPHAKGWLIGKDSDTGRTWGQEEKGMTEDEMAWWHHWFNVHESEWTPGVGDGQRGLGCCDSWGRKLLDTTERLNWTELRFQNWGCNIRCKFLCKVEQTPVFSGICQILRLLLLSVEVILKFKILPFWDQGQCFILRD